MLIHIVPFQQQRKPQLQCVVNNVTDIVPIHCKQRLDIVYNNVRIYKYNIVPINRKLILSSSNYRLYQPQATATATNTTASATTNIIPNNDAKQCRKWKTMDASGLNLKYVW